MLAAELCKQLVVQRLECIAHGDQVPGSSEKAIHRIHQMIGFTEFRAILCPRLASAPRVPAAHGILSTWGSRPFPTARAYP